MGIRHKSHLVRHHIKHQPDELLPGVALDVEFGSYNIPDIIYITVTDMPLIWPWVDGDAFGTVALASHRGKLHIRHIASPCIPYRGNLIDVYTQSRHGFLMLIQRAKL